MIKLQKGTHEEEKSSPEVTSGVVLPNSIIVFWVLANECTSALHSFSLWNFSLVCTRTWMKN